LLNANVLRDGSTAIKPPASTITDPIAIGTTPICPSDAAANPMESARRNMRPTVRKRFYENATVGEVTPFPILLDGRAVKTPAGGALAAATRDLAQAIAAEWNAQGESIDPATMPLTRLANSIIDGVSADPQPVADEIAKYLGSDLVCYRAGSPEGLVHFTRIQLGRDFGDRIEVLSGLEEGQLIAVNPSDEVREGVKVNAVAAPEKAGKKQ